MRTLKYYDDNNHEWIDLEWSALTSGTTFKIFEEDGTIVRDGTGVEEFVAQSDSYLLTISGVGDVWSVNVYDPEITIKTE